MFPSQFITVSFAFNPPPMIHPIYQFLIYVLKTRLSMCRSSEQKLFWVTLRDSPQAHSIPLVSPHLPLLTRPNPWSSHSHLPHATSVPSPLLNECWSFLESLIMQALPIFYLSFRPSPSPTLHINTASQIIFQNHKVGQESIGLFQTQCPHPHFSFHSPNNLAVALALTFYLAIMQSLCFQVCH